MTDTAVKRSEETLRSNRVANRTLVIIALVTAAIVIAIFAVTAIKLDAKASHTESTGDATYGKVVTIFNRQTTNLANSNAIARCEIGDFNDAFNALALAFAGDKNVADYPHAQVCKIPAGTAPSTPPRRTRK